MSQLKVIEQKIVDFNGAEILGVVTSDGKVRIGVAYICNGIGLSENQRDRQVKNIQDDVVLNRGSFKLPVKFDGQVREVLTIELQFLPLWLAKISITPTMVSDNPVLADKLIEYQLRAKDVLAESFIRKKDNTSERFRPWAKKAEQHFKFAKLLTDTTGVKPGIAYAMAIDEAEKETGRSLATYKALLPAAEHEVGFLTASDIADKANMKSGQAVNKKLEELGLQFLESITRKSRKTGEDKVEKAWRLTEEGKKYGEEFPFVRNGHSGYQIRWNDRVISVLNMKETG